MDIKSQTALLSFCTGLNTTLDPVRVPYNPETGVSDLTEAVNIRITNSGRVSRRPGYTSINTDACHSLFCDKGDCLYVSNGSMYQVLPDLTSRLVRDSLGSQRVSYAQVNNSIYYVNKVTRGIVTEGIHADWTFPGQLEDQGNRSFVGPIDNASHIAFHLGRIFLSSDSLIVFSEPFAFSHYDLARNILPFDSRITLMKAVSGGIFISTEKSVYFLSGASPEDFKLLKLSDYPALEWSGAVDLIEGSEVGLEEPGLHAAFITTKGACLGSPTGRLINLTRSKIVYPLTGVSGAGLLRGYDFIQTIS